MVFLRDLYHLCACLVYRRTDWPDQISSVFATSKYGQNLMAWGHSRVTLKIHPHRPCQGSLQGSQVQGAPDLTFASKVLPAPSLFSCEHSRSSSSSPPSTGVY